MIPVLAAIPEPGAAPQGAETSSDADVEAVLIPGEALAEAADTPEPESTEQPETAGPTDEPGPQAHDADSDVTVDLTVDQPAGAAPDVEDPAAVGDTDRHSAVPEMDADSTVDLTLDPADLAELRAARRSGPTELPA